MKTIRLMIVVWGTGFLFCANAVADNLPSPCGAGEVGAGLNCVYLVAAGNSYDPGTGDRSVVGTGLTVNVDLWIDFGTLAVQGGAVDILMDMSNVAMLDWQWSSEFTPGEQTLSGSQTAAGWEGIQFDDFAGNGFGGPTGTQPGFSLVGTLTVTLNADGNLLVSLAQPYTDATFPNCFAPGAFSGAEPVCVMTNFYHLAVSTTNDLDSDADGVADSIDNCTLVANADQRDTNGDGFGNLCDTDFNGDCATNFADLQAISITFFGNDPDTDLTGDGIVNFLDLSVVQDRFFTPPGPSALAACP